MFTGIVGDVGEVIECAPRETGIRLRIATAFPTADIALGASIACGGPCLTVTETGRSGNRDWFDAEVSIETIEKTTIGDWRVGTRINLERSLRLGDELGGHMVSGHVDGTAEIVAVETVGDMARLTFRAPAELSRFIAAKGSVALDGTSLTVNTVAGDDFSVMLIPHTLAVTTWGERQGGDRVNLEIDMMARYVARLTERPV
jgi:riboflavin synthase